MAVASGDTLFDYRARDATGSKRSGQIAAQDVADAEYKLRSDGLFPTEVRAAKATKSHAKRTAAQSNRPLSQRRKAEFIGRLAKLTGSRISLDRALLIIAQGQDGALAGKAEALRLDMREGGSFLEGLRTHAGVDDVATLALVRGAEVSGDLPEALATAASILEQRLKLTRSIFTGLLYPSLLLIIALVSVGLIMVAIIPQFRPLIEERMDLVPMLGRAVFAVSAALSNLWPFIVTAIVLSGFALWLLHRRGRAVPLLGAVVSRVPFVRNFLTRNQMSITLHVLGALLGRDVPMSEALSVVTNSAPAGPTQSALRRLSARVENGEALSAAFAEEGELPSASVELLRIGEETGDLAGMTARAAVEMREASDRALERFLTLFQPALIVLVGLIVGVSLYALFSAIVSVNSISF